MKISPRGTNKNQFIEKCGRLLIKKKALRSILTVQLTGIRIINIYYNLSCSLNVLSNRRFCHSLCEYLTYKGFSEYSTIFIDNSGVKG